MEHTLERPTTLSPDRFLFKEQRYPPFEQLGPGEVRQKNKYYIISIKRRKNKTLVLRFILENTASLGFSNFVTVKLRAGKKKKERKIEKKRGNITSPRYTALIVALRSINNNGNALYLKRQSDTSIKPGKSKWNIKRSTCMREFHPLMIKTKSQCHGTRRLFHSFGACTCTFIASCHFPLLILENKLKFNYATLTYIAELIPPHFSNSKKMKFVIVLYSLLNILIILRLNYMMVK